MRRIAALGFLFGCLFPLLGTLLECLRLGDVSLAGIVRAQESAPLLWIIDSAPVVLSVISCLFWRPEREPPPSPADRRLSALMAGLLLFPVVLIGYALLRNADAVTLARDANRADDLRYRSILAYYYAQDHQTDRLNWERSTMGAIRESLRERYPASIAAGDTSWKSFLEAGSGQQNLLSWNVVDGVRSSAERLVLDIQGREQTRAAEAHGVFVAAAIVLLALIPVSMTLLSRTRRAEAAVRRSENLLQQAQDIARIGSWEFDHHRGRILWSPEVFSVLGFDPALGEPDFETLVARYHPDDQSIQRAVVVQAVMEGTPYSFDARAILDDGQARWVHATGRAIRGEDGTVIRLVGTLQDISERKEAEERLRRSEERLELALQATRDGLWDCDLTTGVMSVDDRLLEILGYSRSDFTGDIGWVDALSLPSGRGETLEIWRLLQRVSRGKESHFSLEHQFRHHSGESIWLLVRGKVVDRGEDDAGRRVVGTVTDISDRKALEVVRDRMMRDAVNRAERDPLTGLLNHRSFYERARLEAERATVTGGSLAVVVMDMDSFKFFNDTYGHLIGDEVLIAVANSLRDATRSGDVLGRIGGDEFALLLPSVDQEEAWRAAARLRDLVHNLAYQPPGESAPVPLRLSAGIALFPEEASQCDETVRLADMRAMEDKAGVPVDGRSEVVRHILRESIGGGFPMLDALVTAVDNKDRYTRRHSEHVLRLLRLLGEELALPEEEILALEVAALVHDVGKIGVPARILRNPGLLTREEIEAVRQHSALGAILVGAVPELAYTLPAVRNHHEAWDGNGYPDGLVGEAIPYSARLMAVADTFSALTTDRPYRKARSIECALTILQAGSGTQWDPSCVAAFIRAIRSSDYSRIN